jgi:hypothetical protein
MLVRKKLFAKLISRIVSLKYPFVTSLVLSQGQVWFVHGSRFPGDIQNQRTLIRCNCFEAECRSNHMAEVRLK